MSYFFIKFQIIFRLALYSHFRAAFCFGISAVAVPCLIVVPDFF